MERKSLNFPQETPKDMDDDYWTSCARKHFDFDDIDYASPKGNSKLASLSNNTQRSDEAHKYDLLRSEGLSEVAENKTTPGDLIGYNLTNVEQSINFTKRSSIFELKVKDTAVKSTKTPASVVKDMILGLSYDLKPFKGREEKVELLRAAVQSHDGNTILIIVLFLRDTLKKSLFQREIGRFPEAVNMYLSYLQEDHERDELANMLLLLDRPEDAAMLMYKSSFVIHSTDRKSKFIENCLNTHFQPGTVHHLLTESLMEHKMCIEDQVLIEDHRKSLFESADPNAELFQELTGRKQLLDSSASCSLICSLLYFPDVSQKAAVSPTSIKDRYKFSSKLYTWCALRSFAASQKWKEVDELFLTKNWRGHTKMRSCISFIRVLEILSKVKAPQEVLSKYVSCLQGEELKMEVARKYKCHSIVIEILKKNKDRVGLIEYKATLSPHSVDFCTCTAILENEPVNWRN